MFKEDLLKGKRILVTGGGSGLGKEMSRYFLKYGAEVLICGRRVGVLEETAKELMDEQGGSVKCYGLDIRGPQDVDNVINEIFEKLHWMVLLITQQEILSLEQKISLIEVLMR